jgi:hypothetical protein
MNLTMDEMIKAQQSLQSEELAWVSNVYRQRLKDLQVAEVQRQKMIGLSGGQK